MFQKKEDVVFDKDDSQLYEHDLRKVLLSQQFKSTS